MPAIYASLTVFFLFGAVSVAIYAAIYGINRPFDDRIAEMGVKMRVAYGNPDNVDMDSDTFANALFRCPGPGNREGGRRRHRSAPQADGNRSRNHVSTSEYSHR